MLKRSPPPKAPSGNKTEKPSECDTVEGGKSADESRVIRSEGTSEKKAEQREEPTQVEILTKAVGNGLAKVLAAATAKNRSPTTKAAAQNALKKLQLRKVQRPNILKASAGKLKKKTETEVKATKRKEMLTSPISVNTPPEDGKRLRTTADEAEQDEIESPLFEQTEAEGSGTSNERLSTEGLSPPEKTKKKLLQEITEGINELIRVNVTRLETIEVKNTPVGVKETTRALARAVEKLDRDLRKVTARAIDDLWETAAEERQEQKYHRKNIETAEVGTETIDEKRREEERKAADIRRNMSKAKTLEKLVETIETEWPNRVFERTKVTKTSILTEKRCRILIVQKKADEDDMTANTVKLLKRDFPALEELDIMEDGEVAKAEYEASRHLIRDKHDRQNVEARTLIIAKMKAGAETIDVAETIQKVAMKAQTIDLKEGDCITLWMPNGLDVKMMQKIVEACWLVTDTKHSVGISVRGRPKPDTDGQQRPKLVEKQQKRNRQGALLVDTNGGTYADVLKSLRQKVNEKDLGVDIRGVKETKAGLRLQLKEKKHGGSEKLASFITQQMNMAARAPTIPLNATVSLYGLDPTNTVDEVREAISKLLKVTGTQSIRVGEIREREGVRSTLIRLTKLDAQKICKAKRIKVGWAACTLREWIRLPMCYKCQDTGHLAVNCTETETKEKRCYKCGSLEHLSKNCTEEKPKCYKCLAEGHTAVSISCPKNIEMLRLRRQNQKREEPTKNGKALDEEASSNTKSSDTRREPDTPDEAMDTQSATAQNEVENGDLDAENQWQKVTSRRRSAKERSRSPLNRENDAENPSNKPQ